MDIAYFCENQDDFIQNHPSFCLFPTRQEDAAKYLACTIYDMAFSAFAAIYYGNTVFCNVPLIP